MDEEPLGEVTSEFAAVQLRIDHGGNGPRLRVEDLRTGRAAFFDALALETLTWASEAALLALHDPSQGRWRDG